MDCTGCVFKGNLDKCKEEICGVHNTWYAQELQKRIDELESERWVTATYYEIEYRGENSKRGMRDGLILEKGKHDYDLVDNQDKVVAMIETHAGCKMSALRKFQVIAKKI